MSPDAGELRGLSATTTVVGVVGDPVRHSLSPRLHNAAFAELGLDWVSVGFPVAAGRLEDALIGMRALGIRGLSVTMPHKEDAAAAVDRRSGRADRLRSVNCITNDDGVLTGDSTDGQGFVDALRHDGRTAPEDLRCLVVGAGGAARSVVLALAEHGARQVVVVNRTATRAAEAAALAGGVGRVGTLADLPDADLVVDATPAGMAGGPEGLWDRASLDALRPGQVVVDLVYAPARTLLLDAAADRGAVAMNGLGMLVHQAARQLATWTGTEPPVAAMWRSVAPAPGSYA